MLETIFAKKIPTDVVTQLCTQDPFPCSAFFPLVQRPWGKQKLKREYVKTAEQTYRDF